MRIVSFVAVVTGLTVSTAGCASRAGDSARSAADAYASAAARGDADALYDMMSAGSRQQRTRAEVRRIVEGEHAELVERGRAFAAKEARVDARATLRFADGEVATLDLEQGHYRVTSAGTLPGGARTPNEALANLRRVIARRSYAGLMSVVTPATRAAIEHDLRTLVIGLEKPATLPIEAHGDDADVAVPGGHHVHLHRDGDIWRVGDFD
jgi:hypothetical protein